jgi:hypothetical protein
MKTVYMSLADILDELRSLGKSKTTGSFFVVSDDQHSATFGLENGRIVSLQCRLRFGEKAIPLIAKIKHATCRFEQTSNFIRKMESSDNEEIFRKILSAREQQHGNSANLSPVPAREQIGAQGSNREALVFTDKQRHDIEDVLVEELGPMGSIVLDSIEQCADIGEIVDVINEEVDGSDIAGMVSLKIKKILNM